MGLEAVTAVLNAEVLLRLVLAFLLGGVIGFERQMHGRPAGLRTHILVCVGSAVIMIAAEFQPNFYTVAPDVRLTIDPGRIVAGIMTGIGFLGAGAIVRTGDFVRGLTTAACIWLVAALGIIIGNGLYGLAMVSTAGVLVVLVVLRHLEHQLEPLVYPALEVSGPIEHFEAVELNCEVILQERGIRIQRRNYDVTSETGHYAFTLFLRMRRMKRSGDLIRALARIPGIGRIGWR